MPLKNQNASIQYRTTISTAPIGFHRDQISSQRRLQAISEVEACGEQWGWRPEHISEADLADGVVKKLKLDEDLPWSEIFNACRALKKKGCYTELCCKP
jgi:hypothetical protein